MLQIMFTKTNYVLLISPPFNFLQSTNCRFKFSCSHVEPHNDKRSIRQFKNMYLFDPMPDSRFSFAGGYDLLPKIINETLYGEGYWLNQYENPEDDCKYKSLKRNLYFESKHLQIFLAQTTCFPQLTHVNTVIK